MEQHQVLASSVQTSSSYMTGALDEIAALGIFAFFLALASSEMMMATMGSRAFRMSKSRRRVSLTYSFKQII